jgi:4-hydroxy-3-polyprenylbenzoate decarboxylase
LIHLENLTALARAGATIVPAMPSFYGKPETLADAIDTVVARVLDHVGISNALVKRWGTK